MSNKHTSSVTESENGGKNRHPAVAYLASLTSDKNRRESRRVLNKIAEMLDHPDMMALDWSQLRYHDAATLREKLIKMYDQFFRNIHLLTPKFATG